MPSVYLPYLNVALDAFALLVTLIVLMSCASEYTKKRTGAKYFLLYQISVSTALVADIVAWICEGNASLAVVTVVSNTLMACFFRVAIIGFMEYLIVCLYANSRVARVIGYMFHVLCGLSVAFCIGNAFFGYSFHVTETGHYEHSQDAIMGFIYLLYPILSALAVVMMALFAKRSSTIRPTAFLAYTLFPVIGVVLDYSVHGLSLTGAGFAISILTIYASIYRTRRREIEAQKNALMLSQINPHFIYNTLSTIASMCDVAPAKAKYLTIDFAQYLRGNINSLSSDASIPFDQELEHLECYLKIEKARFGDRLNVVYLIQCRDFTLPPLTLQPIVENAVKHGITKKQGGGTIKIMTYKAPSSYVIEIIDDGVGFDVENAEMHVGIQNVRNRIAAMCRGEVTIKSTKNVGTRVTIEIPQKKGKK